jgi:hypothetical protein
MSANNQKLYSANEVATIVNSVKSTVIYHISEGLLKAEKVGNCMVIRHDDLVEYLENFNLPESIIEYRLGLRSPKTGKRIEKPAG